MKDSRPAIRGPAPILVLLAFFCVKTLNAQSEAACRTDITESMGYRVRSAKLEARWVSKDLIDRLRKDAAFSKLNFDSVLQADQFIGRAPQQVEQFAEQVVQPVRTRYAKNLGLTPDVKL